MCKINIKDGGTDKAILGVADEESDGDETCEVPFSSLQKLWRWMEPS